MGFVNDIRRRASRVLILLWLAVAVTAIPAAMLAGCGDPESTATSEGGETAQVQLWTCGMHPNVIAEEPGQCPICGMNLTPLKRTAEADELAAGDEAADAEAPAADAGHETEMEHESMG